MSDAYQRIEAGVVAVGEFLDRARRYRPLVVPANAAYRRATAIAARVRRMNRGRESDAEIDALSGEIRAVADDAERALAEFLAGARYRDLIASLEHRMPEAGERIAEIFADVEAVGSVGELYAPLASRMRREPVSSADRSAEAPGPERAPAALEPEAVVEAVMRIAREGLQPQPGPGVGADEEVRPVRFFEGIDGVDSPVLLVVAAGTRFEAPTFRAPEVGEVLVYGRGIRVPFSVGLRRRSPDDWLELRAGGYAEYRRRCRELVEAAGSAVVDVGEE